MLFAITFSQAQLLSSTRNNKGQETTVLRTVSKWLHYDNGSNYTSTGYSSRRDMGVYIKLTPMLLSPYINRPIEEVKFFLGSGATNISDNVTIKIYKDPTAAPVYTEDFPMSSLTAGAWNTVTLSTPFVIDGSEIYIGYRYFAAGSSIIGVDDGANFVPNVNYFSYYGSALQSWEGIFFEKNLNIQVGIGGSQATNDAGFSNEYLPEILPSPANVNIKATIGNFGTNTLNSIDFNYKIDGGAVHTDHLTGLNLATDQNITVTHSVPWNATVGSHNVDVFLSNFNGTGADDVATDDHIIKTVKVASNSTQNIPLYEEFTSSSCSPCATFNSSYFNPSFLSNNAGKYNLVKYQMYWPNVDPYYTAEGGVRKSYYNVISVPTLYLDGGEATHFNTTALQNDLDTAYAADAFFTMTSSYTIDSDTKDINVTVNINPYLTGNYTLHCAVVEKTTTNNATTNGETEFHNVMMKMVPNADGTPVSLVADTPATFNISSNLDGTHIEEYTDLEVVVFLQDDSNKKVMQSTKSTDVTGAVESVVFKNLKVYPNPTTGTIYINNAKNMQLQIFKINGGLVYQQNDLAPNEIIRLDLANGIYLAKFIKNDKVDVRKIVVMK